MAYKTKFQSIVFMGKITSGKGTQARNVLDNFGGTLYSNGDKLRATAKLATPFGEKMKETYEEGLLMPEWIASYWMTHALVAEFPDSNIVFEGVARKPNEAELFDEIHHWIHRPYVVFYLNISDEVVYERSKGRSRDAIDMEQIVGKRLEEYHTYTEQSIEFFRSKGVLVDIDGTLPIDEVKQQIINHLIS